MKNTSLFHPVMALCLMGGAIHAADVPYGHEDFSPTPERPIGYAGNGNAWYPGATPVTEFWEGTPVRKTLKIRKRSKKGEAPIVEAEGWDFADNKSKNIVWKTRMPSWSNSQPITDGKRVFTLSEPFTLVCCDAASGKILWTADGNPWAAAGFAGKDLERLNVLHECWLALPNLDKMAKRSTVSRALIGREWKALTPILKDAVIPRIVAELERVDPGQGWADLGKQMMDAWAQHAATVPDSEEKDPRKKARGVFALLQTVDRRIAELGGERMQFTVLGGKRKGKKTGVNLTPGWHHEVGNMTCPVSDGEHVYASFEVGTTICCDLDGTIVWQRYFGGLENTFSQPPLIHRDTIIVSHNNISMVRALNKRTGETLWEATVWPDAIECTIGNFFVGNHQLIELGQGERATTVLVTRKGRILSLKDGSELGYLPMHDNRVPACGCAIQHSDPFEDGSKVVYKGVQSNGPRGPFAAYKLELQEDGRVVATKLYESNEIVDYAANVATDRFYVNKAVKRGGNIIDAGSGNELHNGKPKIGGYSNILAGTTFFWADPGKKGSESHWNHRRLDGKALTVFHSVDLSDPANPRPLSDKCILGGTDWPGMPAMERLAPELYALDWYAAAGWGKPCHRLNTDRAITAHGDRLYIRTTSDLYCIGKTK